MADEDKPEDISDELLRKYDPERLLRMVAKRAGKGEALDHSIRQKYERRFGVDLGHVRIYSGEFAEEFNKQRNAYAVTLGRSGMILMGGSPDKTGIAGEALLAHELTHVAQGQRAIGGAGGLHRKSFDGELAVGDESRLERAILRLSDLRTSQWKGALWHRVQAKDCDLTELDLSDAQLLRCELGPVRMARVRLHRARIQNCTFTDSELYSADFAGAVVIKSVFDGYAHATVSLSRTDWSDATLFDVDFKGANMYGANLRNATLVRCNLARVNLCSADLVGAKLVGCETTGIDLDGANLG